MRIRTVEIVIGKIVFHLVAMDERGKVVAKRRFVFAAIGELYQTDDSDPTWDRYPEALSNRAQSLAVFLDGYAFERRGRPPQFSVTAARIIAQKKPEDLDPTSV